MRRAASVDLMNLRRETPIILRRQDGSLVEGVVDLAFREEAADFEWTAVDFKTDREFDYTAQVALYAQAIEKATESSVRDSARYLKGTEQRWLALREEESQ